MKPHSLDPVFATLEVQVQAINDSLVIDDMESLVVAADLLRQGVVDLASLAQRLTPDQRKDRELTRQLSRVSARLAMGRESLARRSVLVERKLQTLVPSTSTDTYATPRSNPYGNAVRPSGAFKSFAV